MILNWSNSYCKHCPSAVLSCYSFVIPRSRNGLSRHCTSVSSLPGRSQLRSTAAGQLVVPFSKTKTLEDKGFVISGPSTWNSLSSELHDQTMSLFFQKASENFCFELSYHAVYAASFIIYLILTVNCRMFSRSVHCPFMMACH